MEIEIAGHSGCIIEIANGDEGLFIVKSTNDPAYAGRLKNQAMKQKAFQPQKNSNIKAPRILQVHSDDTCCKIKMEYVYSLNSIAFIENSGFAQINNFLENIIEYVTSEISLSELKNMDDTIVINKYRDVKSKIMANRALADDNVIRSWFPLLDEIFTRNISFQIPVGVCHGDLTFSNILFSGNSFYLIDFLDSFIETPLLDIVKLRQDTAFNWSGLMYSGKYDQVRHAIVLKFMDQKIDTSFSGYQWYRDAYGVFQLLNFLRVLQYAREPRIVVFLKNAVAHLLEDYDE
jgi:hypothetical protein